MFVTKNTYPRISTFEQADWFFRNTTPVQTSGLTPLLPSRRNHKGLYITPASTKARCEGVTYRVPRYVLVHYGSPIIVWEPDRTLVLGVSTMTTNRIQSDVLGKHFGESNGFKFAGPVPFCPGGPHGKSSGLDREAFDRATYVGPAPEICRVEAFNRESTYWEDPGAPEHNFERHALGSGQIQYQMSSSNGALRFNGPCEDQIVPGSRGFIVGPGRKCAIPVLNKALYRAKRTMRSMLTFTPRMAVTQAMRDARYRADEIVMGSMNPSSSLADRLRSVRTVLRKFDLEQQFLAGKLPTPLPLECVAVLMHSNWEELFLEEKSTHKRMADRSFVVGEDWFADHRRVIAKAKDALN